LDGGVHDTREIPARRDEDIAPRERDDVAYARLEAVGADQNSAYATPVFCQRARIEGVASTVCDDKDVTRA
jgi:hypothetical protein